MIIEEARYLVSDAYERVAFIDDFSYGWEFNFRLDEVLYVSEVGQIDSSNIALGWHYTMHGMYNGYFAIVIVRHMYEETKACHSVYLFAEKLTEAEIKLYDHAKILDYYTEFMPHFEEGIRFQMDELINLLKKGE